MAVTGQVLSQVELFLPRTAILTAAETARAMGFTSSEALNRARQAGRLPIPMFQIPGRRGWFAARHIVKEWLENALADTANTRHREAADMSP